MMRGLRRPRRGGRGARGGFTLIEVMVALAVLAFGVLAMLAMQVHALRGARYGRHTTEAARLAQQQMERLHRLPWAHADIQPGPWTALTTEAVTVETAGGTVQEQTYDLQHRVQTVGGNANLRQIDVRVLWTEGGGGTSPQRRYAVSTMRHDDP